MEIANLMETTQEKCYSKMISILSSVVKKRRKRNRKEQEKVPRRHTKVDGLPLIL